MSAVFVDLPALAHNLDEVPLHQRLNLEAELVQVRLFDRNSCTDPFIIRPPAGCGHLKLERKFSRILIKSSDFLFWVELSTLLYKPDFTGICCSENSDFDNWLQDFRAHSMSCQEWVTNGKVDKCQPVPFGLL